MTVEVREIPPGGDLRDFLSVVDHIYRTDPHYVRPLDMELKDLLSPKHPFFEHGEAAAFVAYRNGWCVGRCTASIDRLHLERYQDDTGFFGFFETIDDEEVAKALVNVAGRWLAARGMRRMAGPLGLNINGYFGMLVDGFDTPPMILCPHHRAYQGGLMERAGLSKLKDAFGWRYQSAPLSTRVQSAVDAIKALPEVKTRPADMKELERDIRIIMDVYNDAWSENWGFSPATESELKQMAKEMKLILDPSLVYIAEIDGEPAAVALALPNMNEALRDLGGKLFPLGFAKLLWRLKVKKPSSARVIILGIRKKYRSNRRYGALSAYLYARLNEDGPKAGYSWGELSWTLEDNGPVNTAIKMMGGKIYKTYRLYSRDL